MKVRIVTTNGTHNYAQCLNCKWDSDDLEGRNLTNECVKHVKRTGHTVVREVANAIHYSPLP